MKHDRISQALALWLNKRNLGVQPDLYGLPAAVALEFLKICEWEAE